MPTTFRAQRPTWQGEMANWPMEPVKPPITSDDCMKILIHTYTHMYRMSKAREKAFTQKQLKQALLIINTHMQAYKDVCVYVCIRVR